MEELQTGELVRSGQLEAEDFLKGRGVGVLNRFARGAAWAGSQVQREDPGHVWLGEALAAVD